MAGQAYDWGHAWVFPDVDGVLGVTVGGDEFGGAVGEEEVADLAAGVVGFDQVRVVVAAGCVVVVARVGEEGG